MNRTGAPHPGRHHDPSSSRLTACLHGLGYRITVGTRIIAHGVGAIICDKEIPIREHILTDLRHRERSLNLMA